MAAQTDRVVSELRAMMVSGELQPGERIIELQFAARLNVSRTPLRLALAELEKEGLLERLASRGFRVRAFSVDDIADAVDVRGVLEGMAARLIAERGASESWLLKMHAVVDEGRNLLEPAINKPWITIDALAWSKVNGRFHQLLVDETRNRALIAALQNNNKTPLTGPTVLMLPRIPSRLETTFVLRAQSDHEDLLLAITRREASRAEGIMREHAYRSRENKRQLINQARHAHRNAGNPAESPLLGFNFTTK